MPITFRHQFFEYLLNYFMFFFSWPLCALYSPLHGRLAKADCTTPCKICSQAFKTHFWRQVMFSRIFWEGHFFKFQSNLFLWFEFLGSFFFLISGHFFVSPLDHCGVLFGFLGVSSNNSFLIFSHLTYMGLFLFNQKSPIKWAGSWVFTI